MIRRLIHIYAILSFSGGFVNGFSAVPTRPSATTLPFSRLTIVVRSDTNEVLDTVVTEKEEETTPTQDEATPTRRSKREMVRNALKKLATLSLKDYQWRSALFKSNEADRMMEESLARLRGEDASYVRPMDAGEGKLGPLGEAEKSAVAWLSRVIEEEGLRAERIAQSEGDLVRPMDVATDGPLGELERQAVEFVDRIRDSEIERMNTMTLRPKDLEQSKRGPLGEAEAKLSGALEAIRESEMLRRNQTELRGGEVVRPIDVPGPIGEFEMAVAEIYRAEQQRVREAEATNISVVRPKDAKLKGPLGEAELEAIESFQRLAEEECERLKNIQKVLEENRPMETNRWSLLGFSEALIVGILRGPTLLMSVTERVKELMKSSLLSEEDLEELEKQESYILKMPNVDEDELSSQ